MALLGPRVGKEDVHAGERCRRNHRGDDFDRIVPDDAHVGEAAFVELLQQAADARRVHLDAEEIVVRPRLRDRRRRLAHAEADLEHARRAAAEHAIEVERRRARTAMPRRGQQRRRARAAARATCGPAQHEAAHGPVMGAARPASVTVHGASRERPVGRPASLRVERAQALPSRRRRCTRSRASRRPSTSRPRRSTARPAATRAPCARRRGVTRHTATSFVHRRSQKSAVTRRCRSGESFGSAGRLDLRPVVRCSEQRTTRRRRR